MSFVAIVLLDGCQKIQYLSTAELSFLSDEFEPLSTKSELPTHNILRIAIDNLEQLSSIEQDSSIIIFHYCSPDDSNLLGSFSCSSTPYITIYNPDGSNYSGKASYVFGTVSHELGHATHYFMNGLVSFASTEEIIRESFASFFGWYNVMQYYSSIVLNDQAVSNICGEGRQDWESSDFPYTPFYVDLYDNYNQHIDNTSYNEDPIYSLPLSFILDLSLGQTTFQSVSSLLSTGVYQYFTPSELSSFMAPYSYF